MRRGKTCCFLYTLLDKVDILTGYFKEQNVEKKYENKRYPFGLCSRPTTLTFAKNYTFLCDNQSLIKQNYKMQKFKYL